MRHPARAVTRLLVVLVIAGCTASQDAASTRPDAPSPLAPAAAFPAIEGAALLVHGARDRSPAVTDAEVSALAAGNAEFALDLYRSLAVGNDENVLLGPHSISTALAMVYAGSRGETAREMADVLHLERAPSDVGPVFNALGLALESRSDDGVVDLRLANQAFAIPGMTFLDEYLETLGRDFGAPMAELALADTERARTVINDWAADRTGDRITELFPRGALDPRTVLVLVNAISMDAAWTFLFDPAETRDAPFRLPGGRSVEVPTMHFDLYLPLSEGSDFQAVELPYGDGDLSMVVVVPEDIDAFDAAIDGERLSAILDGISEQGIHLSLPKFGFSSHTPLDETLKALGMESVYGAAADLSGMIGTRGLFLSTVQHGAFIEVDEEGTEAHAATGAGVAASHGPTITVDRSFFFVIRDRPTGAILFLGRVSDPRG